MLRFENVTFAAKGANKKDKVYGLNISGANDVLVKDCTFSGTGYAGIYNHCSGQVEVENCDFQCDNLYNPIENSQSVAIGNMVINGCEFEGIPGNNFVNFYKVSPGSVHMIQNCSFAGSTDNNVIRLSNIDSNVASFFVDDCTYDFVQGEPSDYTGFMLCQDYTNKNGKKQNFNMYTVDITNLFCDGEKVAKEPVKGCLYYVYEDDKGIITGTNDPRVNIH